VAADLFGFDNTSQQGGTWRGVKTRDPSSLGVSYRQTRPIAAGDIIGYGSPQWPIANGASRRRRLSPRSAAAGRFFRQDAAAPLPRSRRAGRAARTTKFAVNPLGARRNGRTMNSSSWSDGRYRIRLRRGPYTRLSRQVIRHALPCDVQRQFLGPSAPGFAGTPRGCGAWRPFFSESFAKEVRPILRQYSIRPDSSLRRIALFGSAIAVLIFGSTKDRRAHLEFGSRWGHGTNSHTQVVVQPDQPTSSPHQAAFHLLRPLRASSRYSTKPREIDDIAESGLAATARSIMFSASSRLRPCSTNTLGVQVTLGWFGLNLERVPEIAFRNASPLPKRSSAIANAHNNTQRGGLLSGVSSIACVGF